MSGDVNRTNQENIRRRAEEEGRKTSRTPENIARIAEHYKIKQKISMKNFIMILKKSIYYSEWRTSSREFDNF